MLQNIKIHWLCSAGLMLFIMGCADHHVYPRNWPLMETALKDSCPNIAGVYKEIGIGEIVGQCIVSDGRLFGLCYSLSHYMLSSHLSINQETRVAISQPDGEILDVEVLNGPVSLYKKTLYKQKGDFTCNHDGLIIKRPRDTQAEGIGFATVWSTVAFGKDLNGSLIMSEKILSLGMVMYLFPIGGTSTEWFRWEPYTEKRS